MREAQRLAKRAARKLRRSAEGEALDVIESLGLADHPLARRLARRLAGVESEIGMLKRIVARVGRVKRGGDLTEPYERLLTLENQDRAELRALLDRLAEIVAKGGQGGEFTRLVLASLDAEERASVGRGFAPVAAPAAAVAPQSDAGAPDDASPLPDAPRSVVDRAEAAAWSDDADPDAFDAPDPFESLPTPKAERPPAPVAARPGPTTPATTEPVFRPGIDGPVGSWTDLATGGRSRMDDDD
jgi:hypothetical protein